ncbi:unnamed protein product [Lactuca saligna]|uniref:Pentatricopeptide repeat-containing protein n=1 Tax=Lactuca saligna TaxID=75948 RepID=A0AA35ZD93_LACSI|nr:unnamed protein product [Lactuca saligna]
MKFMKLVKIQIPPSTAQTVHHHHHIPNGLSYAAYGRLIQHCTNHRLIRQGKLLHAKLILSSVTLNNFLASKLITFYSKTSKLFEAQQVFEQLPNKNTFSWNVLFRGYSMNKHHTDTLMLFRCFLSASSMSIKPYYYTVTWYSQRELYNECKELYFKMLDLEDIRPNEFTIISILEACAQSNDLDLGMKVHRFVIDNDIKTDLPVVYQDVHATWFCNGSHESFQGNEKTMFEYMECCDLRIIDTYTKLGFLDRARIVFDRSEKKSVIIWRSIISAYSSHGDVNTTLDLFNQLTKEGIYPDPMIVTSVLSACADHSGYVNEALSIFKCIRPKYGIQPSMEDYDCMVSILIKASKLYEVVKLIEEMPFQPTGERWDALFKEA